MEQSALARDGNMDLSLTLAVVFFQAKTFGLKMFVLFLTVNCHYWLVDETSSTPLRLLTLAVDTKMPTTPKK